MSIWLMTGMCCVRVMTLMRRAVPERVLLCVCVCTPILATLPPVLGWGRYIIDAHGTSCCFDFIDTQPRNRAFIMYLYVLGFVLPVTTMISGYTYIVRRLRVIAASAQPRHVYLADANAFRSVVYVL